MPRPYPSLPDTFPGNEQCKKITILCAKPMVFFFLIFMLRYYMFTVKFLWKVLYVTDNTFTSPIFMWGIIRRLHRARAQTTLKWHWFLMSVKFISFSVLYWHFLFHWHTCFVPRIILVNRHSMVLCYYFCSTLDASKNYCNWRHEWTVQWAARISCPIT